jgi:hypothetical protein
VEVSFATKAAGTSLAKIRNRSSSHVIPIRRLAQRISEKEGAFRSAVRNRSYKTKKRGWYRCANIECRKDVTPTVVSKASCSCTGYLEAINKGVRRVNSRHIVNCARHYDFAHDFPPLAPFDFRSSLVSVCLKPKQDNTALRRTLCLPDRSNPAAARSNGE